MYAMQYEVTLPADYDMKIIRHRVATKGPALDTLPGLGVKAYLIRERGVDDSPVNQYAPFYLWVSVDGMNNFLFGGGFRGFADSFGRPPVRHWSGVAFAHGPDRAAAPVLASRHTRPIAPDADATGAVEDAIDELRQRSGEPGVFLTALALDTQRWEMVHFTLWVDAAAATGGTRYEVLHLSRPHLAELKVGRHW